MIPRYSREEMSKIWTDESKYNNWLSVELAVCKAWVEEGRIPEKAFRVIKERAGFKLERIEELEKTLKHDVISFLTAVGEQIGEESSYVHLGMTSSDVLDTAFAMQLRDSSDILIEDIQGVMEELTKLACTYKNTPIIGRSHGVHAEPTTMGLVFAVWFDEMRRNLKRMKRAREEITVGKISGVVGTFANIPPTVEEYACKLLGLRPARISTQIVQRDIHADFFLTLAVIAGVIERIAVQIRHYQRTEVLELEEPFTEGQKGSSAMPHKRNPIISENLTGLSRLVRSYAVAALENIPLWHEHDISHSSAERIIGPDSTTLLDFMLVRLAELLSGLNVYPENMERNLWLTKGLIFSQKVLLKLIEGGMSREEAYECVQKNAMKCWREKVNFQDLLLMDPEVSDRLSPRELEECFSPEKDLEYVDYIFERVFRE
ncbi:MAG: adenylosuccinate lyase [Candidatus Dadabacteria bacterium]|nr:adenylosuccinate lyase [Candidatus Dadabacteria bacterium]